MSLKSKHILELTAQEKQQFLDSFDTILSDCDGVIWTLLESIPNTGEAINLLKNEGKSYKFISNNSMRTDDEYLRKFEEIGAKDVTKDDLVYPAKTIIEYVNDNYPQQPCFVIGCKTFQTTLRENGVNVKTVVPPSHVEIEDVPNLIHFTVPAAAVIFDINFNMSYIELALAEQHLKHKDCRFMVGAYDGALPISKNLTTFGPAFVVNMLASICNKKIDLFGKPGHFLGQYILDRYKITQPKRCIFVGDNLETDVKFGKDLGFQTLFVLSGAHTLEDMRAKPVDLQPDYYADTMGDFIKFFNDLN